MPSRIVALAAAALAVVAAACTSNPKTTSGTLVGNVSTTSSSAQASASSALTGMGANVAEMTAAHGADWKRGGACTAVNACFGPQIFSEGQKTWQFGDVLVSDGLVTGYTQSFPAGTSLATAETEIMQWMPKDSMLGQLSVDHNGGSCAMLDVTSPTLGKVFSDPKIGDPQGEVGVVMDTITANIETVYNPSDIEEAVLSVAPVDPSTSC